MLVCEYLSLGVFFLGLVL